MGTALIKYDFVLVTETSVADLRQEESKRALASQGQSFRFIDGLPVPDVDRRSINRIHLDDKICVRESLDEVIAK